MLLGVNLTLLIGPTVAVPAPPDIAEAIQSVQVTHNDEGRSGFQIMLQIGRAGPTDLLDYRLLLNPLLRPFNRVILVVIFNAMPRVLMDGVITHHQFSPGNQPGVATLTLTGEDVSVMMDLEKKRRAHPMQSEIMIVPKIIGNYAQYGLKPEVTPPRANEVPLPVQRTPGQQSTDLEYLKQMARRFGYVFYIEPGPARFTNTAYWGPPKRDEGQQRALSVNLGPESNVESVNFTYNAMAPTIVKDEVQDSQTNKTLPVNTLSSTRFPPLVRQPQLSSNLSNVRTSLLENASGGLPSAQVMARAQGVTDRSIDAVVTASGELDALRYGDLLRPRSVVGLRGVGFTYDGLYYVKSVSHSISKGQYRQRFSLTREGVGALTPVVIP